MIKFGILFATEYNAFISNPKKAEMQNLSDKFTTHNAIELITIGPEKPISFFKTKILLYFKFIYFQILQRA